MSKAFPVNPLFRVLSGRFKITVRRHEFNKDSLTIVARQCKRCAWSAAATSSWLEGAAVESERNNLNDFGLKSGMAVLLCPKSLDSSTFHSVEFVRSDFERNVTKLVQRGSASALRRRLLVPHACHDHESRDHPKQLFLGFLLCGNFEQKCKETDGSAFLSSIYECSKELLKHIVVILVVIY